MHYANSFGIAQQLSRIMITSTKLQSCLLQLQNTVWARKTILCNR